MRKPASPAPASPAKGEDNVPRITKKIPRESDFQRTAKERALAGVYRVITSNVMVPRPENMWKDSEGKQLPGEPTLELAEPGDELYLGNEDALRLLEQNVVEELDTRPSRVGKVFTPPRVAHNMNAGPNEPPKHVQPPAHGPRI